MRLRIVFGLLLVLLLSLGSVSAQTTTITPYRPARVYTPSGTINARSCPRTTCERVGQFRAGDRITVYGWTNGEAVNPGNTIWLQTLLNDEPAFIYAPLVRLWTATTSSTTSTTTSSNISQPANPAPVISAPVTSSFVCPRNCDGARAMGLTAQQAATCPGLDRDRDGVACYGD